MSFRGLRFAIGFLLAASCNVIAMPMATQVPVRLWAEVTIDAGLWTVVPHVEATAGSELRYEIVAAKSGRSGRSNARQSGRFTIGADGSRALSSLRLGVGPDDRCDVEVTVFSDTDIVANLTLHLPR